jgi:hypothetical protein
MSIEIDATGAMRPNSAASQPSPERSDIDIARDQFEREANDARFFPAEICFARTKSPSGRDEYANSHLQSRWEGWQAHAAESAAGKAHENTLRDDSIEVLMHKHGLINVAGDNPALEAKLIAFALDARRATADNVVPDCPYIKTGDRMEEFEQCTKCGDVRYNSTTPTKCQGAIAHLAKYATAQSKTNQSPQTEVKD